MGYEIQRRLQILSNDTCNTLNSYDNAELVGICVGTPVQKASVSSSNCALCPAKFEHGSTPVEPCTVLNFHLVIGYSGLCI